MVRLLEGGSGSGGVEVEVKASAAALYLRLLSLGAPKLAKPIAARRAGDGSSSIGVVMVVLVVGEWIVV